jgi:hypothetical protein
MSISTTTSTTPQPRRDPAAEVAYWARQVAACALIEDLAGWFGVHGDTVWQCLREITDDDLWMLDSPRGWGLLGGFVQARLGIDAPPYSPQVH